MADTSQVWSSPAASNKHYQWVLNDGHQWKNINHDSVIETHYCQPGAKGINISTGNYGDIFLDFDQMMIKGTKMKLFRNIILRQNESEEYGWYFFDSTQWKEYGCQSSSNVQASVTSGDIEQIYQQNPSSSCTFTAGRMNYDIDFSVMTQTNLQTKMKRNVRRRPKLKSIIQNVKKSMNPSVVSPSDNSWVWQYRNVDGAWKEYEKQTGMLNWCSASSQDIEQIYQQNPQGQLLFSTNDFQYVLDFSEMVQINKSTGTKRDVIRVPRSTTKSLPNSFPNGTGRWIWQYKGNGDVWTDFKSGLGQICSVNSDDVERSYQQNQRGQLPFTAVGHHFTIDFSGMHMFSNGLEGSLDIRRIPANNTNISSVNTVTSWMWQFMGEEGVWTDFQTNIAHGRVCSVSSNDVETNYQQNPQGQLQFTAGRFSYTLYFSGMYQVNNELGTKRSVRRISVNNQQIHTTPQASGNYIWEFKNIDGYWTEYTQNRCSVSSQDIEQHYLQNPTGILQFMAGRFTYKLDFTAMTQQNMKTLATRPVQHTLLG